MKTFVMLTLVLLALSLGAQAFSETGYKRSPWGSKKWDGAGTPPHFSSQPSTEPPPVDPGWGLRPPQHRPDRWGRVYYYEKAPAETIIIETEKESEVYVPAVPAIRQESPVRCGGRTATRKDPVSGELIIEYVTSSRECPE
ncbi:MAG: hypothetical protein V2I35_03940 [Desulfocapsaceae bacterium]|jgi:hypothetical protein|nr:hypothetical protein [Desulfocapsaceae bacterium]